MILMVSGRCDIPAFYSEWFFNRLKEGFVDVRNPYNSHQISRILLHEEQIDAMIFCSKNPTPMIARLEEIKIPFLFHVTLTPYHQDIEPYVINKDTIIESIKVLSKKIGKEKVIVRYDPIFISDTYSINYHAKAFERLCEQVGADIQKVIISFIDVYKNTQANQQYLKMYPMEEALMKQGAKVLGVIAARYHVNVQTCAKAVDLQAYGIKQGLCFD